MRRILPKGTGYITDLGMTGPHESILGRNIDRVLKSIVTQVPTRYDIAEKDLRIEGVVITVNKKTGKAEKIKRVRVTKMTITKILINFSPSPQGQLMNCT